MQAMQSVISLGPPPGPPGRSSAPSDGPHRNSAVQQTAPPGQPDSPNAIAITTAPDANVPRRRQANGSSTAAGQSQQLPTQNHPDRRYKCSFCARAFSRSEHKNRHERSREYQGAVVILTWLTHLTMCRHQRTAVQPPIVGQADDVPLQSQYHHQQSASHQHHTNPEISAAMLMTRLGAPPATWNGKIEEDDFEPVQQESEVEYDDDDDDDDDGDDEQSRESGTSSDSSQNPASLRRLLRETLLILDPSGNILRDTPLPTHRDLSYHLTTYIAAHHPFHPFVHLPTFSPHNTPRPLLLAILSLGALPTNKELASRLHVASKMMVNSRIDTDGFTSRSAPLWVTQTVLLNTAFAAWSGDPRGLEFACSVKSFLANLASGVRYELLRRTPKPPITNSASEDDEWIKLEAMRRTYFAVYVFFGGLTAFFNFPPAIPNSEPGVVTLPCEEEVWNGTTPLPPAPAVTFRVGMDYVLKGQHMRCSSFAKRILATGMFLECWAARSGGLLFAARTDQLEGVLSSFVRVIHADIVGCLNRASEATWKLARMRVVGLDLSTVEEVLRYHDVGEIVHAVRGCAARMARTGETLVVAAEVAMDVLFGVNQEDRTGGIEDVVVGWECALYLMMWLRRVERDMSILAGDKVLYYRAPDERELDVLQRLRAVQEHELHGNGIVDIEGGEDRLSVFIGWWWARYGARGVGGGWGIRSVLREAIGVYAEIVRAEIVV
ncbi:hypothetical protein V1508DRAFT_405820 [Lipomyces doorenjongii]|uniref:uncharacterized protein n=1 Tax=Lipomyces doorenjongii TaxID=383834 RepID=UPI0034CE7B5F